MEIWKKIEGFENYSVSTHGRIKNGKTGKILKGTYNNCGYHFVILRHSCKQVCRTTHRLVAEAFIPNPDNLSDVNHIDEDKSNNCVENLEWLSHKDNIMHGTGVHRMRDTLRHHYNSFEYKLKKDIDLFISALTPVCITDINKKKLPINIDGLIYENATIAANQIGVTKARISQMIKEGKCNWVYDYNYMWAPLIVDFKKIRNF